MSPVQNTSDETGGAFPRSKEGVPIWDGSGESFQSYAEAARLFEQTTQYQKRYLCGPRLQAELTGAAKRLVIGQRPEWLSFAGGVERLLEHLGRCLGKPQIPELTDLMSKYFRGSRRKTGESMSDYITRKCEIYIRAQQAMARVKPHHEDRRHQRTTEQPSWWQPTSSGRRNSFESWTTDPEPPSEAGASETQAAAPVSEAGTNGNTEPPVPDDQWSDHSWRDSTWGWSSWSWGWGSSYYWGQQAYTTPQAPAVLPDLVPEFVQAWMLLQDAQLDANEKNMVLTAVQSDMRLQRVAQELRTQFPESETRRRDAGRKFHGMWGEAQDDGDDEEIAEDVTMEPPDLDEEGQALWTEATQAVETAWAAYQGSKRTLKMAREKQKEVRLNRKYFRGSHSNSTAGGATRDDSQLTCLRCGALGHRAAVCPAEKPKPKSTSTAQAPFVCYCDEASLVAESQELPSTSEAIAQGNCIIDSGATKSLGSVYALEQVMRLSSETNFVVDTQDQPRFGFGNSTEDVCLSTTQVPISAGGRAGHLRVHALDRGQGPILLSIEALRNLKAVVDFSEDLMVLRGLNARKVIRLGRSSSGHQLLPLTKDLFEKAEDATDEVPSLATFLRSPHNEE